MAAEIVIDDSVIAAAERLVTEIKSGNQERAAETLDELVKARETSMYQELGKLTREFHDALMSFRIDSRISSLAEDDIPDARERLNHVITMTQTAADRTLSAVEQSLPLCDALVDEAVSLKQKWDRFQKREMTAAEFREVAKLIDAFLVVAETKSIDLRARLNDVLMAQDFQDLTGQIIRRVIQLVEEVEANLVNLIKLSSQRMVPQAADPNPASAGSSATAKKDAIAAEGPVVPALKPESAVSGQDEVDDLLSSLGF